MSIVNELQRIEKNIVNAYTALGEKGAELPADKNSNNLASTINNLEMGGSDEWVNAIFSTGLPAKIEIPKHITKVRDYACYAHSTYKVWEATIAEVSGANVEELGNYAFAGQNALVKIDFPNAKRIGDNCFMITGSSPLKYVRLGALEYIGSLAFQAMFNTTDCEYHFSLADGCEIGSSAFNSCTFTSFDFSGVKSIGESVFINAKKKMKIWLPASIETISCTSSNTSMFYNSKLNHTIYTDVTDETSVPSGWGSYWNKASTTKQNVVYGATYEDYLNAEV